MKIKLDLDELVGVMMQDTYNNFYYAMQQLHPEFTDALEKRLKYLNDIVESGRELNHD